MRSLLLFLMLGMFCGTPLYSQPIVDDDGRLPGQWIVQLEKGTAPEQLSSLLATRAPFPATVLREVAGSMGIYLIGLEEQGQDARQVRAWLQQLPGVRAVQANYQVEERALPDDPDYTSQWGVNRVGAPQVWDFAQGGATVNGDTIVLAVVDSGFEPAHEDIAPNMWKNAHEVPGDGIDNDNNGYIDDIFGWDYRRDSNELYFDSHGLGVAGLMGAKGNNGLGVTGINWDTRLMCFSVQAVDQIISAYEYIIEQRRRYNETMGAQGAFVVGLNMSIGLSGAVFCEEQPVWGGLFDELGAVGILTSAGTVNTDRDVDLEGDMPTTCESEYLMTVLNATEDDDRYSSSGYGKVSIDMAAPGQGSYSTAPFNRYGSFGGNSAAAPHLTGSIGLLYSLPCQVLADLALSDPPAAARLVRDVLFEGVDVMPTFKPFSVTGGRLNVENAMNLLSEACNEGESEVDIFTVYPNPASTWVNIVYETPDYEVYEFRVYNTLGQQVYRATDRPVQFTPKILEVDVSNWQAGVYIVEIIRGGEMSAQSFVVTR